MLLFFFKIGLDRLLFCKWVRTREIFLPERSYTWKAQRSGIKTQNALYTQGDDIKTIRAGKISRRSLRLDKTSPSLQAIRSRIRWADLFHHLCSTSELFFATITYQDSPLLVHDLAYHFNLSAIATSSIPHSTFSSATRHNPGRDFRSLQKPELQLITQVRKPKTVLTSAENHKNGRWLSWCKITQPAYDKHPSLE